MPAAASREPTASAQCSSGWWSCVRTMRTLGSIIATGQAWLWLWTFDVQYHQLLVRVSLSRKCLWTTML